MFDTRQQILKHVAVAGALVYSLCSLIGCLWGPVFIENRVLTRPERFVRLDADGTAHLDKSGCVRLAGIRVRDGTETGDHDALAQIPRLIGDRVEIERLSADGSTAVWFPTPIWYFCGTPYVFPHPFTLLHFVNRYERGCLNEMLIHIGVASFDDASVQLPETFRAVLASAQARYDAARRTAGVRPVSLSELPSHPEVYYYHIRVAPRDRPATQPDAD